MLGEIIHGYRVDRALSGDKGGFGDVYFASHVESGAEAVVKVLKPEMSAQRDIVERFFNEARAAASVHHPGIVQIHNMGYHRDRAYLLMERLRGDDLETRLARGPVPLDRAVLFLRQAAGAIGAAHDRGIVHRDLKPANLFVVPDPDVVGGERVRVLDFGIAKLTDGAGVGKTQGVFGTPSYMSPEQCASAAAVDGRSDLYALGCIFYELTCGRPPFGHGGLELIASHLRDAPLPPRTLAPWLPPAIEQVILRLLEKQPGHRYPSCAALVAALDEAARSSGLPTDSAPVPVSGSGSNSTQHPSVSQAPSRGWSSTRGDALGVARTSGKGHGPVKWIGLTAVVFAGAVAAVAVVAGRTKIADPSAGTDSAVAVATVPVDSDAIASTPTVTADAASGAVTMRARAVPGSPEAIAAISAQLVVEGDAAMRAVPPRIEEALMKYGDAAARTGSAPAYFGMALAALQQGDFERAVIAIREALAAAPSADLTERATSLQDRIGRELTTRRIELHSREQATQLNEQGNEEMSHDRFDTALAMFRRAYGLDPRATYLLASGVAALRGGECVDARRVFARVIGTWPDQPAARKAQDLLEKYRTCE